MFAVGMDVDRLVFTELHQFSFHKQEIILIGEWEKILLYAEKFCISNPLVFITIGKSYLNFKDLSLQSAGNFSTSIKSSDKTKNTYNSYSNLPKISKHITKHKSNLTDLEFGYFLAGIIEGDG
jgi:hypothetical protein